MLPRCCATFVHHHRDVVAQRVLVICITNADVAHVMTLCAQPLSEASHRGKDCKHLLCMVQHVVSFTAHLHHHVGD